MKILVSDTVGFIGSLVAIKLCERGDEVIGFDNLSDYYDVTLKQAGNVRDTEADVSELIAAVDYRPAVSVEHGASRFVNWYGRYYA